MVRGAIAWSVRRPRVVVFAWLCIAVAAAVFAAGSRREMFPPLAPDSAVVQTEAPGLAADQVERLVTRPLEAALQGEAGVAAVRSESIQGLSVITLDLASGVDAQAVHQRLGARIAVGAQELPAGVDPPRLQPLTSPAGEVEKVGFTSARLDPMQLRSLVQWVVRPRMLAVPGIARVSVYGGQTRRIEVRARLGDLSDSDLGLLDVVKAVQRETSVAGAGFIDTPTQRVLIEPRGQALTAEQLAAGQIQSAGAAPVRIGDVSDVVDAPAPPVGDALVMGRQGVILSAQAQYGASTVDEAKAADRALDELRPALAAQGVVVTQGLDRADDVIVSAVRSVLVDLAVGAALAFVLMLIALRDVRAAAIAFATMVLSMVLAMAALRVLGLSLNTMTLGGLVLGLGVVIDDALIDLENVLSRLRDAEARHASHAEAVLRASLEVRAPVLVGTLVIALSLLPLVLLPGSAGALLRPLALAAVLVMAASVLTTVLATPALAMLLLPHVGPEPHPPFVARLRGAHGRWIERGCARPGLAVWPALGTVAVTVLALVLIAKAGPPELHGGRVLADLTWPGSISPEAMRDLGGRISREVLTLPGVKAVSAEIGRDPTDERAWGVDRMRLDVGLGSSPSLADQDRVERGVRKLLAGYPGLEATVSSAFGEDGAPEAPRARFSVAVVGDDSQALGAVADQVAAVMRALPDAREVRAPDAPVAPAVRVDLNFQSLAIYGLSAADVMETVQTAFQGQRAARVYEAGRAVDLAVTAGSDLSRDPEAVGSLLLRSTSGFSTPLKRVANVYLTEAPTSIAHEGGLAQALVTADPPAKAAAKFDKAARAAIARSVSPPAGVYIVYPQGSGEGARARRALLLGVFIAVAGLLVVLLIALRSGRSAALILSAGPAALAGGVAAVALSGGGLGYGAVAGLIAVFGLTARSAILLLARIEDLVLRRRAPWSLPTLVAAAQDRAIPILAAALCIGLGLSPLIVLDGQPGAEVLRPMAAVILGGILTGTAFNLLVLPLLAYLFWRAPRMETSG
jgi:Cu/Ag efflux pump CusA